MEPILPPAIPSAASAARSAAEQGEKTGSAGAAPSGEHRFESILKRTVAGREGPAEGKPTAHGGRRAANAGKKAKADTSTSPYDSAAVSGSAAPNAPEESLPATGGATSDLKDSGVAKTDPAQASRAGGPGAVPAPPTAPASDPKSDGSANADPAPVVAGAATLPAEGDLIPKQLSSGVDPATADGVENSAPALEPKAGGPGAVPAPSSAATSEPKNAGSARVDGILAWYGNADLAPEGTWGSEGSRKKKDDASARIEGQIGPATSQPADGNLGVAERPAPIRPVVPASDMGVVRFEEKAFVITRKSDTSVEVTLAPPGVGKLEIEVVLEKGVVNARILAADFAGREAIARSLPQIVEALARDGMNVGGFTVSLKERRDREGHAPGRGASRDQAPRLLSAVTQASSASAMSAGLVNIFV